MDAGEVYKAASLGSLDTLKLSLKCLAEQKTESCTPLIIACRNGHTEIVEWLIKTCGVDVEQV